MDRIAIMQPYLFPYIGYFQMIHAVDLFVFYDDVNFIKKGWINRNRILLNKTDFLFTVPLEKPSQNKMIYETKISYESNEFKKLLVTIENAYSKAPYFDDVMPLVTAVFEKKCITINELAQESVIAFCAYLSIHTELKSSQNVYANHALRKGERLIDICHQENKVEYINAPGGMDLYAKDDFEKKGIKLLFIKSKPVVYDQFAPPFVPWLSIIDVAMFNDKEKIREFLNAYELV